MSNEKNRSRNDSAVNPKVPTSRVYRVGSNGP